MLTEFGKMCRKIRIDANELLVDMAAKLQVSAAFLSAVETGKKGVPDPEKWVQIITEHYYLDEEEQDRLLAAARDAVVQVKIRTNGLNQVDRELVLSFARNFDKLSQTDKDKILRILRK